MISGTVLITGAGGFIGRSLIRRMLDSHVDARIIATDISPHPFLESVSSQVEFVRADLGVAEACRRIVTPEIDTVFHFAALVSGGAEEHFEAGFNVNVYGMINMLEACRLAGHAPRFVFTSTIASFGGQRMPGVVDDWTHQHPQSSYGAAKVVGEQLLNDYSRRGFVDGRAARLAATVVRDDPHAGLSCSTSAIVREPVAGRDYACPLPPDARMPILGIDRCLDLLTGLAALPAGGLGDYRTVNAPNISSSLQELADAVRDSGADGLGEITFDPSPQAAAIVATWPDAMKFERAAELGFEADESVERIVQDYIERTRAR